MNGLQVFNDKGELIVGSTMRYPSEVGRFPITLVNTWNLQATKIPALTLGVCGHPSLNIVNPLTLIKFNQHIPTGGCGQTYYSEGAGELIHFGLDNTVTSGYLDVFDESGVLKWSAAMASKIPRVSRTVLLTYAELLAGTSFNIASDELMMVSNLISFNMPAPFNGAQQGGVFWYKEGNTIQFCVNSRSGSYQPILLNAYQDYGLTIYLYKY